MTTRLLEATGSFPAGNDGEVVLPFLAADLQMIGQKGSLELVAFEISGDGGADITIKKAYVRRTKDPDQGRHVGLKSTNGWKIAKLNKFCGPEAWNPPAWMRYDVLDGYELVLEGDNANASPIVLVLEAVIENHTVGSDVNLSALPARLGAFNPGQASPHAGMQVGSTYNLPTGDHVLQIPLGPHNRPGGVLD